MIKAIHLDPWLQDKYVVKKINLHTVIVLLNFFNHLLHSNCLQWQWQNL